MGRHPGRHPEPTQENFTEIFGKWSESITRSQAFEALGITGNRFNLMGKPPRTKSHRRFDRLREVKMTGGSETGAE